MARPDEVVCVLIAFCVQLLQILTGHHRLHYPFHVGKAQLHLLTGKPEINSQSNFRIALR